MIGGGGMLVCKFGGSALRQAEDFRRARQIIEADPARRWIVPSAPGKRSAQDEKVTDLLYACQSAAAGGSAFLHIFDRVAQRMRALAAALALPDIDGMLRKVYETLRGGADAAYAASRGEYLCGYLLAAFLQLPFVDAAEVIRFDREGRLDEAKTQALLRERLRALPGAVIPGFYGADDTGAIHTFARGGSDVTGALVASALNADAYENWKDVRGVYAADPRVVPDARIVPEMSYRELRAYSRLGAGVLCEAAVAPVRRAGIPLHVRSFEDIAHPGTWIHSMPGQISARFIGVTGESGLTRVRLERMEGGMELLRSLLPERPRAAHLFADDDSLTLLLRSGAQLPGAQDERVQVRVQPHMALVSAVGTQLGRMGGMQRLCAALSAQGIRVWAAHQMPDDMYLCAVVAQNELSGAVRAVYDAFVRT